MGQRIIPLSECPQFADVCAARAFGQWGSQHGGSLERTQQRFAQCSRPSDDHLTLMMIDGDRPVGMASLWPSDDHQRRGSHPVAGRRLRASRSPLQGHCPPHGDGDRRSGAAAPSFDFASHHRQIGSAVRRLGLAAPERRRQYDEDVVVMVKTL